MIVRLQQERVPSPDTGRRHGNGAALTIGPVATAMPIKPFDFHENIGPAPRSSGERAIIL